MCECDNLITSKTQCTVGIGAASKVRLQPQKVKYVVSNFSKVFSSFELLYSFMKFMTMPFLDSSSNAKTLLGRG